MTEKQKNLMHEFEKYPELTADILYLYRNGKGFNLMWWGKFLANINAALTKAALTEAPKVDVPFPPQCEICDRYVKQTSIRALGPGPQCCNDCYLGWYDGSPENNKQSIKKYVLDKYGETGGEGINLKEYIDHITTHYDLVKKEKKND